MGSLGRPAEQWSACPHAACQALLGGWPLPVRARRCSLGAARSGVFLAPSRGRRVGERCRRDRRTPVGVPLSWPAGGGEPNRGEGGLSAAELWGPAGRGAARCCQVLQSPSLPKLSVTAQTQQLLHCSVGPAHLASGGRACEPHGSRAQAGAAADAAAAARPPWSRPPLPGTAARCPARRAGRRGPWRWAAASWAAVCSRAPSPTCRPAGPAQALPAAAPRPPPAAAAGAGRRQRRQPPPPAQARPLPRTQRQ